MQQYLFTQTEIFKRFTSDNDFNRQYKEFIFDTLTQSVNQQEIAMSTEGFAAFQAAIEAPAQIVPAIAALRQHKAPWDKV